MKTILTIGRQYGSGGREIGQKLADHYGIKCYDRDLVAHVAKDSGFCKEIIQREDERPTSSFLYNLVMDTYSFGHGAAAAFTDMPLSQKVFLAQFETIKELAAKGGCVIIGRCADYALEENPHLLSIFIHADYDFRIKRIMEEASLSETKARELINKTDKSRGQYYNYYTGRKWGVAANYHVSLDSSRFGIDETVEFICSMAQIKSQRDEII